MPTRRPKTADDPPFWWTVPEIAKYARCSTKKVCREIGRGRLKAAQIGGHGRFVSKRDWVDQWIETSTAPVEVRPRSVA